MNKFAKIIVACLSIAIVVVGMFFIAVRLFCWLMAGVPG